MTVTVEHVATEHSGHGTTPRYRCHCGLVFLDAGAAHACRHRLRPVPVMQKSHNPPAVIGVGRQDLPEEFGSYVGDDQLRFLEADR